MKFLGKACAGSISLLLACLVTGYASAPDAPAEFSKDQEIHVLTREEGSGTRSAFGELTGLVEKQADGSEKDSTTQTASVTNSTSVMLTTVKDDPAAVGYISLGSLNDSVKPLKIDGSPADAASIKDGSYKISRPFNIVVKEELSAPAKDFMDFILSNQGQKVVADNGCIPLDTTATWTPADVSGKVVVSGSSSVTPVMEKLAEAYKEKQPNVQVEIQQSDSSSGIQDAADGVSDIGMASRDLKDSELTEGVKPVVIAMDGIAVIVNPSNTAEDLSTEQVKEIFSGEKTLWSDVLG